MSIDPGQIIQRFENLKNSTERSNFENLFEDCAEYCSPRNNNINKVTTAGERKSVRRLTDAGIRSNRVFAAGMTSHLIPAGSKFFTFGTRNEKLRDDDEVKRYFNEVTRVTYDVLNNSNFFDQCSKSLAHIGYIGTCCIYADPSEENIINFKSYYINQYYIAEDAYGNVDTVFFELNLTARQAVQLFGDAVSEKICSDAKSPKSADSKHQIIHAIYPRSDYKRGSLKKDEKRIASVYIECKTKKVIKESGYDVSPCAVGRFYQTSDEVYGRSPAMEVISTLSMLNAMEKTRIETAQRASNPPWLVPNGGDTQWVSNDQGAVITYNAQNPQSKPEQLNVRDNVVVNDAMIKIKSDEVGDAFFTTLFDPLVNHRNMTAREASIRTSLATQNLVPAISRMINGLLVPLFKRIYDILQKEGQYPPLPDALKNAKDIDMDISFNSKATMALKQLEIAGAFQTLESMALLQQVAPEVLDNFDFDAIARATAEAYSMPNTMIKSKFNVKKDRDARAKAQASKAQLDAAQQLGTVYKDTREAPEEGSVGENLMNQLGGI